MAKMTRSSGKAAKNYHGEKKHPEWGENFYVGSGGKRFEGAGKGRAGGSGSTWVSSMGMPSFPGKTKTSSRQKPGSKAR